MMDRYLIDTKEFSKHKHGKSSHSREDVLLNTDVFKQSKNTLVPDLKRKTSEPRKTNSSLQRIKKDFQDVQTYDNDNRYNNKSREPDSYSNPGRDILRELQILRKIITECPHCSYRAATLSTDLLQSSVHENSNAFNINLQPIPFTTKPRTAQSTTLCQAVQTDCDLRIFRLLEQKIQEIGRYNRQLTRNLRKYEEMGKYKSVELNEMEEKFSAFAYKVTEDLFLFQRMFEQYVHLRNLAQFVPQLPSYLKVLAGDQAACRTNSSTDKY